MVASLRGGSSRRRAPEAQPTVEIIPELTILPPDTNAARVRRRRRSVHDFGAGPVPAQRHRNPDGSPGGWVADTAHVDPTVILASEATVADNARVFDDTAILDRAHVGGNVRIYGGSISGTSRVVGDVTLRDAHVRDRAVVSGSADIWENVVIAGDAVVEGQARVLRGSTITDQARVGGDAWIQGGAVCERAVVEGSACVSAGATVRGDAHLDAGRVDTLAP